MNPDEPVVEKDALQMEADLLALFADIRNPKTKKIVQMAKTLLATHTHEIEQRMLKDIIYHRDPMGFVHRCIEIVGDVMFMTPRFIADGYHGMIINDHDVYPVKVKAQPHWLVRDWPWTEDQELDIQRQVLAEYLEVYEIDHVVAKVMLFSEFGFSGIPRIIESGRNKSVAA